MMELRGFPGYQIDSLGQITGCRGWKLKPGNARDYLTVVLYRCGRRHTKYVHLLVADHYLPPKPSDEHEINHIDHDKGNPAASNLEWLTHQKNITAAQERGLYAKAHLSSRDRKRWGRRASQNT